MLLGSSQVRFRDSKSAIDMAQDITMLAPMTEGAVAVDWDHATTVALSLGDLEQTPAEGGQFLSPPSGAGKAKSYDSWSRDFSAWLFRTQTAQFFKSPITKELSKPGESERDFRIRLQQSGREQRDKAAEALRQKYAPRIAVLHEKVRRAEQQKQKQQVESRSSQMQAAISVGASILGAFLGRKTISATNIGRAATAIRGAGRVLKESQDVNLAGENVAALQKQVTDLESQFKSETEALAAASDPLSEKLDTLTLRPSKANIAVKLVTLAWTPHWRLSDGSLTPAWM